MINKTSVFIRKLNKAISYYRFIRKAEYFSRDELESFQLDRLKKTVSYAAIHVPYYRDMFHSIGFEPQDLRSFDDLKKLPYLTKEQLCKNPEAFLSDEIDKLNPIYAKTSGSTGIPLKMAQDEELDAVSYAFLYHVCTIAGYRFLANQFFLRSYYSRPEPCGYLPIKNQVWAHAYKASEPDFVTKVSKLLKRHPPTHIFGHTTALTILGKMLSNPHKLFHKLRGITTAAEVLTPELRSQLNECFGVKVYDFYGNVELSTAGYETLDKGYLFAEYLFYPEIVSENGDSNNGELISTSFFSKGMPLIRYRSTDVLEFDSNCRDGGCSLRRIKKIHGRIADILITPDGSPRRVISLLNATHDNVLMYQIEQTLPTQVYINIVPKVSEHPVNCKDMVNELSDYLGPDVGVKVRIVKELKKKPSGKIPQVIQNIKEVGK